MLVLPLGDAVAEAITPTSLARLNDRNRDDLRIALTIIKLADTMAELMRFRGTHLTRITNANPHHFHYGTAVTGVVLRPIDDHGAVIALDDTIGLDTVSAVAILAVDMSLKEATTQ